MKKAGLLIALVMVIALVGYLILSNGEELSVENHQQIEVQAIVAPVGSDNEPVKNETPAIIESRDDRAISGTTIVFNGKSVSVNGEGVNVSGTTVTIVESGTYNLSGTFDDGQVVVNTDAAEPVELIFDGVSLNSSNTSPLYIAQADEVIINLSGNSKNTIKDGSNYVFPEAGIDEPNAALFSKDDLTITGTGELIVYGNYNDGIGVKDKLKIEGGMLTVHAVDDGIRSKDKLTIKNGIIAVEAGGDGFKSDNADDKTKGNIKIEDGTITITSTGDAIQAASDIQVEGGSFNLTTSGKRTSTGQYISSKGFNAGDSLSVQGETFTINSYDDAIHSNNYLSITKGNFMLSTKDDGVHADSLLIINGGVINILTCYEGIESQVVKIEGGEITINSSDDGFSIASGRGGQMGFGRRGGGGLSGSNFLYINEGYTYINANGDGIDVNGSVEMTGGTLLISGPTTNMNGAIDYDGSFKITGGLVVAAGSSGMAQMPGGTSTQNSVLVYLTSTVQGGSTFNLQKSNGENIFSFAPVKNFQSVAISSPELENGESYNVYVGGQVSGESKNGFYEDGQYSSGEKIASFTVNNVYTTIGSGGRTGMGSRGGGGGMRGGRP